MKTIYHRNAAWWGDSTVIVIDGGNALVKVSRDKRLPPDCAYISDLMVLNSERDKRLGNRLLKLAEEEAVYMGANHAMLDCDSTGFIPEWYKRHRYKVYKKEDNRLFLIKNLQYL